MKKRKTIKYKQDSPMNYQFGGTTLAGTKFFDGLNKQWGDFWKGGDYFKQDGMLSNLVDKNKNAGKDIYDIYGDKDSKSYDPNYQINQQYLSDLEQIKSYEKAKGEPNFDEREWANIQDTYLSVQGKQQNENFDPNYDYGKFRDKYKSYNSGEAVTNTAAGIFTGLNYQNAYKPPKPIDLQKGFQGVEYAQMGTEIPQYGLPEISMTKQTSYPAPQYAAPTTTQAPVMGIVQNLQKHGYSFPPDFNKKPLQEQKQTVDSYIADFNQKQSKRNSQIEGTLIHTQTRPLSADFLSTSGNQDDEFKMWFAEQVKSGKVGTIQNYKGKPINIQLGGKSDNGSKEGKQKYISGLAKDLYNMALGGEVNLTGYTQGSPTANNKINIIPGSEGTMQGVNQDLIAIGRDGADKGLIKKLDKTTPQFKFKSNSFLELPVKKNEENPMIAQFGSAIQYLYDQNANINRSYLDQIAGNAEFGPSVSTPEFNNRMITGRTNYLNSQPTNQKPFDFSKEQTAYTEPISGDNTNYGPELQLTRAPFESTIKPVVNLKGDRTYDYMQDANGNWLTKRKNSSGNWINMQDKLSPEKYKVAVNNIQKGNIKQATTATGRDKTSKGASTIISKQKGAGFEDGFYDYTTSRGLPASNETYAQYKSPSGNFDFLNFGRGTPPVSDIAPIPESPNGNSNNGPHYGFTPAPGYVPLSTNSYKTSPQDEQVMRDGLYGLAGFAAGNMAANLTMKGIVNLPKVGRVVQYGSKYIDKAGNYVSKTGKILGKASDTVMKRVNKNLYKNFKSTPDTWDDVINTGLEKTRFANIQNYNPGVRTSFSPVPKQYGGFIPTFQFGGQVNNDYSYPVQPITEEFTDIQTEKGEVVSLPDGTIVDVKAIDMHKNMHKHDITDILPGESHVFSNDAKMKLNLDSSIGGVKIKDMKLGKTTFEYKENEVTVGPKDIMLSDIWGKKKELTPAELVNNIKSKFELRDNKNNFLTQRANEENKEQRLLYLDIVKAFSEYKKPKSRREVPKAQYGMTLPSANVGLPSVYNQLTNNGVDAMMGYNDKSLDPYGNMDNNIKSMYNISSVVDPKLYQNGGDIPHAPLGLLIGAAAAPLIGKGIGWLTGNSAKKKQELENQKYLAQYNASTQGYLDSVNRHGGLEVGSNLAQYAAGLNVHRQLYDDQSEQLALTNDHYRNREAALQAEKYGQLNSLGGANSMARYTNPNNIGQYLAQSQQGYNQNISNLNSQIGSTQDQKVQTIMNLLGQRNAGYNDSENTYRNQLYNVNVSGIGAVGNSLATAEANKGQAKYQTDLERMAFERQLRSDAQNAYDRRSSQWEGIFNTVGSGLSGVSNYMDYSKLSGLNNAPTTQQIPVTGNQVPSINFTNPIQQQFGFQNNTVIPGYSVNRSGTIINPNINWFKN